MCIDGNLIIDALIVFYNQALGIVISKWPNHIYSRDKFLLANLK